MSLIRNYNDEVLFQLAEAGLSRYLSRTIGRPYRFGCIHGSHHQILVGIITALEVSDEGGFQLQVSNLRFWGRPLLGLTWNVDKKVWMAYIDVQKVEDRFYEGEFALL